MDFSTLMLLILPLVTCFQTGNANYSKISVENDEDEFVYQAYMDIDKSLKKWAHSGVKMANSFFMEANAHLNLTTRCKRDIFHLISGIRQLRLSAVRFLDATAKIPDGLLPGGLNVIGDYTECLQSSVTRMDGSIAFRGQYCLLHLRPPLPKKKGRFQLDKSFQKLTERTKNASELMRFVVSRSRPFYDVSLKWGVCVPSGCSIEDIRQATKYLAPKLYLNASIAYCDIDEGVPLPISRVIAICAFSLIGFLLIVGTAVDYYRKEKNVKFQGQLLYYFENVTSYYFQIVTNGFLVVDIFFFMGGLTNMYGRMKMTENKKQVNPFLLIIHRLWRIYPAYVFSILVSHLFQDAHGPMNSILSPIFGQKCETYWWQNLIFINNFFVQSDTCMPHTWYVAADMHLYLLSLITIPLFFRKGKRGIVLNTTMIFIGISSTALWVWHKGIMPALILHNWDMDELNRVWNAYTTTLPHIAPYFTGIMTGYVLYSLKDLKIPKVYLFFGWPTAGVALTSMLFLTVRWNKGIKYTIAESALYFAFSRFVYVLAVTWMVVCCSRGYGGIINYILSLRLWVPLARMSYMVYLISPILQIFHSSNIQSVPDSLPTIALWRFASEVTISCLLGFLLVVTTESPFIRMEKLIFHKDCSNESKPGVNLDESHGNSASDGKKLNNSELQMNLKNTLGSIQVNMS